MKWSLIGIILFVLPFVYSESFEELEVLKFSHQSYSLFYILLLALLFFGIIAVLYIVGVADGFKRQI